MFTHQSVALPLKQCAGQGRRLVAVDIENVVGGAVLDLALAAEAWQRIDEVIGCRRQDQVVVGASHISAIAAWRARSSARLVVRSGANGADIALLQVLEEESIESRFDEVVVVSGDGIFSDAVARLGRFGVHVTVASRRSCLARRLRMAAAAQVLIPDFEQTMGSAA